MLTSLLLHLNGRQQARAVVEAGVAVARRHGARLRGFSLADTRSLQSLSTSCEGAAYTVFEQQRLHRQEHRDNSTLREFSEACLAADLDFDIRRLSGDPLELLPQECRFHDLVVLFHADRVEGNLFDEEPGWKPRDLTLLLQRGVQPLLVVRRPKQPMKRVLLVYDGTPAAGRSIRSYLEHNIAEGAEHRLLAIGDSTQDARETLQKATDYFHARDFPLETGWINGPARKVLVPYAEKWNADLVVLGANRINPVVRHLRGETVQDALQRLSAALYLTS